MYYNFEEPENIPTSLQNQFDMVVIDPPFITKGVWESYQKSVTKLLKHDLFSSDKKNNKRKENPNQRDAGQSYILATTIAENESLMKDLFNARPTVFRPNIPNLIYQYKVYTNCIDQCEALKNKNPECLL